MSSIKFGNLDFSIERLQTIIGNRTQREFAEWIDESPSTVTEWVKGRNKPGWNFLVKLAKRGVNVNWFLTGEGEMYIKRQQAGELPANVQTLLHELEGWSAMIDDIIGLVRAKKEVLAADQKVKAFFQRKKKK